MGIGFPWHRFYIDVYIRQANTWQPLSAKGWISSKAALCGAGQVKEEASSFANPLPTIMVVPTGLEPVFSA
jgi:hypothetical protein